MDLRYFNYINLGTPYYSKNSKSYEYDEFTLEYTKKYYEKIEDGHWVNYLYKFEELPEQGWKIHISTLPKNAQEVLNKVSKELLKKNISFKFVKNYQQLVEKNSKYADRTASGKFITIYPQNYQQFICLLNDLDNLLKGFPLGPYILSDKRWYESNVYFRYGAFKAMYFYKNGKKIYAIRQPNGELIEDSRKVYYNLPHFIKEPIEIKNMDKNMDKKITETSKLDDYTINQVLHYSNGGGVYLAKGRDDINYVIKEGRPGSGLDMLENDAFQRINQEAKCLYKLTENKYPVKIYDFFKEWDHNFLVEEYIEGETLNKWIVNNYPFYTNINNQKYKENAMCILHQLYEAVWEVHKENIGLGDLSPNNIMVNKSYNIRLIDFETADTSLQSDTPIELNTLGFSGSKSMNREKTDWFALLRIARFIFLPIGPVQDISLDITKTHDHFIKKYFGLEPLKLIEKIEKKCASLQVEPISNFITYTTNSTEITNLVEVKKKILAHLYKNIFTQNKLINGDIRQYEIKDGEKNILTGDYGMIFTLNRIGEKYDDLKDWSIKQNIDDLIDMDESLFLGKVGVATALWENEEKERAKKILRSLNAYKNSEDITITSGLAGIGLAFIGFSYEVELQDYLLNAIEIGEKLDVLLKENSKIHTYDVDITNIGLMNGWSGVSLFFSALYKRTNNNKWLVLSELALKKDLDIGFYNDNDNTYHLDDVYRLMPYLDGGSAGLGLAVIEFNIAKNKNNYQKELSGIKQLANSKTFYNLGLFRGTLGIIDVARSIDKYNGKKSDYKLLNNLKSHLIFNETEILSPGEFNYRLSDDLFSGSLGTLLILEAMQSNVNFLWMPIPNIKKVFYSNESKQ